MKLSFPLFRIFGIQVRIHWLFPIFIAVNILNGVFESGGGSLLAGFYACIMAGFVLSTLIHELGHCFEARRVGGHAHEILLWPLGGMAYVGHGGSTRDDIKVAAMGPLMHLPLAAGAAGVLVFVLKQPWSWSYLNLFRNWYPFYPFAEAFGANLALGFFKTQLVLFCLNLFVPAFPLDGGRILMNLLLMRYGRERAARVSTYFSFPIGLAFLVGGMLGRDVNCIVLAVWILFEAWQIQRLVQFGQVEGHPMFADAPEYDPGRGEEPRRKGLFARWKDRRARRQIAREREEVGERQSRVDEVLEKVSREGLGSLTPEERKILDDASRRSRGE